jgi:TM2 domain-containing membrane protein YozV/RNA polymerase subunit RPABC4/transcription elongation factor Spt4
MRDIPEKGADAYSCPRCRTIIKKEAELCPKCGVPRTKWRNGSEVFCSSCGEKIRGEAEICPKCGIRQNGIAGDLVKSTVRVSTSDWLTALLFAIFLGALGIHRFYVKKIGTGIIMLLLCWTPISWVWAIIDIIMIATGKFKDYAGKLLLEGSAQHKG